MNSDECPPNMEYNNMIPQIKNHQYKKSMINPIQLRPPLEIQLPEHVPDAYASSNTVHKQLKQDSATHKT
jgi:hypothetical protein